MTVWLNSTQDASIYYSTGVRRQKQLQLPDRQKQQRSLSSIWEILNAG